MGLTGAHAKTTRLCDSFRRLTCFRMPLMIHCPDLRVPFRNVTRTVRLLVNTCVTWPRTRADSVLSYTVLTTNQVPLRLKPGRLCRHRFAHWNLSSCRTRIARCCCVSSQCHRWRRRCQPASFWPTRWWRHGCPECSERTLLPANRHLHCWLCRVARPTGPRCRAGSPPVRPLVLRLRTLRSFAVVTCTSCTSDV